MTLATRCTGVLFAATITSVLSAPVNSAGAEPARTISLYHIHSKETLTVTYKKDGKYVASALKQINWLMRDWRDNDAIEIDPEAIDILWEMHTELGSKEPIHIICGYRSRKTNNMLRQTRGGQAQNSHHITGKAIDAAFPDVPVRQVRYSAMIRQSGGVGYYPTSAIPFVHVDTARVRHWPRMSRDELALLFPNGSSKHVPSGGGHISSSDVERARSRSKDLAAQIAAFHDYRKQPKTPTVIAALVPPKPSPAVRPSGIAGSERVTPEADSGWSVDTRPNLQIASLEPAKPQREKPARFQPGPSDADRARLQRLIAEAEFVPLEEPPLLLRNTNLSETGNSGSRYPADSNAAAVPTSTAGAVPTSDPERQVDTTPADAAINEDSRETGRFNWAEGLISGLDETWVQAPEYDDDHPDELAYRPFPIEPLLTATPDDSSLATLVRPDNAKTLAFIDSDGSVPPMRLRPPQQVAQLMWRQEFTGAAVQIYDPDTDAGPTQAAGHGIETRQVTTSPR